MARLRDFREQLEEGTMTNEEFIQLCIETNRSLKEKFRTYSSDILLEEIISRVRKEEEKE